MIPADYERDLTVDGVKVHVELEPDCWLGGAGRLGILLRCAHGTATLRSRRSFGRASAQDVERLIRRLRWIRCGRAGCEARYPASDRAEDNPEGLCNEHRLEGIHARARAKAKGFRYKATVWIHRDDRDDVYAELYFVERPTRAALRAEAIRRGSRLADDFTIARLE